MKLLQRIPEHVLRTRWFQWLIIVGGPVAVFGITYLGNLAAGTASAPGCGAHVVVLAGADQAGLLDSLGRVVPALADLRPPTTQCASAPFTADIGNMTLAVAAGLAVSVYVLFNLRLRLLRGDLESTGLISERSVARSGLGDTLTVLTPPRGTQARLFDAALLLISIVGSAGMYYWLYLNGPIFRDLAGSYTHLGAVGVTAESLRDNWWANHEHHPTNTALGIAVGALGLYLALKQRAVFVIFARALARLRKLPHPVEFVPRWIDRDYGWRPVGGLINIGYIAIFTFLAAFSAALYLLRSDEPGLKQWLSIVLAVVASIALFANGLFFISMVFTVRRIFGASVQRERLRILAGLRSLEGRSGRLVRVAAAEGPKTPARGRRRSIARLYLLTEGSWLAEVPGYPIGGRTLRFAGAIPVVGALWPFLVEVGRAFGI